MKERFTSSKLILISVLFLFLFNAPLLEIWNKQEMVAGFPSLFIYLFAVWILCILLLFFIITYGKNK